MEMDKTKRKKERQEETELHTAVREGNTDIVVDLITSHPGDLKHLLAEQNLSGETALYVAAEKGDADMVIKLMIHYDLVLARIKANNGFDAFHIAAKHGHLQVLEVLMEANPDLSLTLDASSTTPLHTAATHGHTQIVHLLLDRCLDLAAMARCNGKTALHSAARHGHLCIVQQLLDKKPSGCITRVDRKGQTALHMAVKGRNPHLVSLLLTSEPSLINVSDTRGNTPLHIAVRKGRSKIIEELLRHGEMSKAAVNRCGETALDTAENTGLQEIASILRKHGFENARSIRRPTRPPATASAATELRESVREEIGNEEQEVMEQTSERRGHVAKRVNKMHTEGLNNAINSTTVVAILIATVAFAAIFSVPGQYMDDPQDVPKGYSLGEARAGVKPEFLMFVVFDAFALFISLAVVVVQTSVVVIERKAKKKMMGVINKLMWLACVLISAAFLALSFVVVGEREKPLAIGISVVGALIMVSTIGTMCYWVIANRIQTSTPFSEFTDHNHNTKLYAV